jgi:hypothetical protein
VSRKYEEKRLREIASESQLNRRRARPTSPTEPVDVEWPWAVFLGRPGTYLIRGLRLNVKLTPTGAQGLIGGYADVNSWYDQLVRSWSTHHSSYGGLSQPSLYPVLRRLHSPGQMVAANGTATATAR